MTGTSCAGGGSSGNGGRSSSSSQGGVSSFCGADGAALCCTNAPLAIFSSKRLMRACKACISAIASGLHSRSRHSSASILRLALVLKPAAASRSKAVMRSSSSGVNIGSSSFSSFCVQMPEIIPASFEAVRKIKRSRATVHSSSSMAARSLPSAYCV